MESLFPDDAPRPHAPSPLAERMRPRTFDEFVGQEELLAPGKPLREAIERGASWITLEARESNTVAQALYRKYGFSTVATRKAYYSDNSENAVVMWAGNLRGELYQNRLAALENALTEALERDDDR